MSALQLPANQDVFNDIIKAYNEKHRYYHNFSHIAATLQHLDKVQSLIENPELVELALWFHDAVYAPFSSTNERDSADWAVQFLQDNQVDYQRIKKVESLIMVTLHDTQNTAEIMKVDEQWMIDIDLGILGAPEKVYQQFEDNVRKEYKRVPLFIYKRKRREILKNFLQRENIYNTAIFQQKYEDIARKNLLSAIEKLN
ncbi:N-methyl-D-aspartate receptor NMDAR2C subunit [Aliikangiella maris]|uniref:N-methyl-D-aspartate receptor NMDAR2C subunit n=2 Tax=Aliikangiella maris TaxID=3162458 RepID=A0ABV3MNV9_9GAMM